MYLQLHQGVDESSPSLQTVQSQWGNGQTAVGTDQTPALFSGNIQYTRSVEMYTPKYKTKQIFNHQIIKTQKLILIIILMIMIIIIIILSIKKHPNDCTFPRNDVLSEYHKI